MQDVLIQAALTEGFLCDEHISIDATHFEARDAAKPAEKKEIAPPQKRGRQTKEEYTAWLAEQAEIQANQSTCEREIKYQLDIPLETLWREAPIEPKWGIKKDSEGKTHSDTALKVI